MRFIFKTSYNQDIDLFKHNGQRFWYALLGIVVLLAPLFLGNFYQGQLSLLYIYAIAGAGLMILVGYTGLVSLGHAAFFAIGAYAYSLLGNAGLPFLLSLPLAGVVAALLGVFVGIAALRMTGIYLAIATLAFAVIVEKVLAEWGSLTGGHGGLRVPEPEIFGFGLGSTTAFYYLCLTILVLVLLALINLLRSPTGRAFKAVRDSEISAQAMGVNLFRTKTLAFSISAGVTGLAGALYAYKFAVLFPDSFTIIDSITLLMLVVVGGLGSMHGVILGAIFVTLVPPMIAIVKDVLPDTVARAGLEPFTFGLILILFLMFEPLGLYGRWVKIRLYFSQFPLYRKATFRRQR